MKCGKNWQLNLAKSFLSETSTNRLRNVVCLEKTEHGARHSLFFILWCFLSESYNRIQHQFLPSGGSS